MSEDLEKLKLELEELRAFKAKWDAAYPGLTPDGVKNMEQQLFALYNQNDNGPVPDMVTEYQGQLSETTK